METFVWQLHICRGRSRKFWKGWPGHLSTCQLYRCFLFVWKFYKNNTKFQRKRDDCGPLGLPLNPPLVNTRPDSPVSKPDGRGSEKARNWKQSVIQYTLRPHLIRLLVIQEAEGQVKTTVTLVQSSTVNKLWHIPIPPFLFYPCTMNKWKYQIFRKNKNKTKRREKFGPLFKSKRRFSSVLHFSVFMRLISCNLQQYQFYLSFTRLSSLLRTF